MNQQKLLLGLIVTLTVAALGLGWMVFTDTKPDVLLSIKTVDTNLATDVVESEPEESDSPAHGALDIADLTTEQTPSSQSFAGMVITVHIEPTTSAKQTLEHWQTNQRLIALADEYNMNLSLHFSPTMATFVSKNPASLAMVHSWESSGHEIAVHHHDPSHVNWDGYSDDPTMISKSGYLGTISDMFSTVSVLSADGIILTGSGTSNPSEWYRGLIYGSRGGSPPSYRDMVHTAQTEMMGSTLVTFLPKSPFGVDMISAANATTLEHIKEAVQTAAPDEYIGFTVTDETLDDESFADLEQVFQYLDEEGLTTQTIEALLSK